FDSGQWGNRTRSYYQGQTLDSKPSLENQANEEPCIEYYGKDMEIGYEDNPSPVTFESLEQRFLHEIVNLVKEQSDSEDAENARHWEFIIEINNKFQDKLLALRAQQASQMEEFLNKESQARLQHQIARSSPHHCIGLPNARGYRSTPVAAAAGEAHRAYSIAFEPSRDQSQFLGGGRTGSEAKVSYPVGCIYN
ncbi:LOW QUALITY PROTEIN: hypothetical protein CFOL_v3_29855, partial [Cephalotus follicularis]